MHIVCTHFPKYGHKNCRNVSEEYYVYMYVILLGIHVHLIGFVTTYECSHITILAAAFTACISTISLPAAVGANVTNRHAFLTIKFSIADTRFLY